MSELTTRDALSWPDDRLLTRKEASEYAHALGVRLAIATLAKYAWRGDGPIITYIGAKPYYRPQHVRDWLASRTDHRRSTRPRPPRA